MNNSLAEYCKKNGMENLIAEWDYEANSPLTPDVISYGSTKKVSWKCSKGHKWMATVNNRTRWSNCPYCSGRKICEDNCLAYRYPQIASEWDADQNGSVTPHDVMPGTLKKYWWVCSNGHSYQASVNSRTSHESGCPYCSNQKVLKGYNDLASTNPEIADEWDINRNEISPDKVLYGSNKKYWWICKVGHKYEASVSSRVGGSGCPFCSGLYVTEKNSLEKNNKRVADFWDYERNYPSTPSDVAVKSSKNAFWKCYKGHTWNAKISDMTSKNLGCPYCSGKRASEENNLETLFPIIAKQWDYSKNIKSPAEVTAYSNKKVWWICEKGHSWQAVINNRVTNGTGCPFCNNKSTSFPEQAILYYCRQVYKEVFSRDNRAIGKELDIYIPEINTAIEYDGTRWHQGKQDAEIEKDSLCEKNGIKLFRIIEDGLQNQHLPSVRCIYLKKSNMADLENAIRLMFRELKVIDQVDVDLQRDHLKIREGYASIATEDSLLSNYPLIAKQWDYEKNGKLKPEMFSPGSGAKVWWKCENDHSWRAEIGSRVDGRGCPYCTHKLASDTYNLKVIHPDLMEEWDYNKNELLPEHFLPQSTKKVWWLCSKGHSYLMPINHRTKDKCNCPYCSGKRINSENCLESLFPELVKEWDYVKNTTLRPSEIGKGYSKKVWWLCPQGHSYQMTVHARTSQGQGCIFCAGKAFDETNSFAGKHPELLEEWDYSKNTIDPNEVGPGSGKKAWWICPNGHSFEAIISNRAKGSRCPYCTGRIKRKNKS